MNRKDGHVAPIGVRAGIPEDPTNARGSFLVGSHRVMGTSSCMSTANGCKPCSSSNVSKVHCGTAASCGRNAASRRGCVTSGSSPRAYGHARAPPRARNNATKLHTPQPHRFPGIPGLSVCTTRFSPRKEARLSDAAHLVDDVLFTQPMHIDTAHVDRLRQARREQAGRRQTRA